MESNQDTGEVVFHSFDHIGNRKNEVINIIEHKKTEIVIIIAHYDKFRVKIIHEVRHRNATTLSRKRKHDNKRRDHVESAHIEIFKIFKGSINASQRSGLHTMGASEIKAELAMVVCS